MAKHAKRNLEVCRKCDAYTVSQDPETRDWESYCRKEAELGDEGMLIEENMFAQFPLPSACPYALEHMMTTDEDSTDVE